MNQEQKNLLCKLSAVDFAQWELHIFLDTHPDNAQALQALADYRQKRDELAAKYEAAYGPLSVVTDADGSNQKWQWVSSPWPWEDDMSCNEKEGE